jgi:uncharacterized membrane protein
MNIRTAIHVCIVFYTVSCAQAAEQMSNLGNVIGGDFNKAHAIIDKKCTSCHSKDKINIALTSGKDMIAVQKEMEKRGARLTSNERDVLGIFWKQSRPVTSK